MSECNARKPEISLGDDFGDVLVKVNGATIDVSAAGYVVATSPSGVEWRHAAIPDDDTTNPAPANDTASKVTHEIGAIESTGEHKGEIYGGVYPADNRPIWFSAAPQIMDHYAAAAWAKEQGGSLPTGKQGDYLTTLKGNGGAFTEIFNRGSSFPAGHVWLAEFGTTHDDRYLAWCQQLSDGDQGLSDRNHELPVLCVLR